MKEAIFLFFMLGALFGFLAGYGVRFLQGISEIDEPPKKGQ